MAGVIAPKWKKSFGLGDKAQHQQGQVLVGTAFVSQFFKKKQKKQKNIALELKVWESLTLIIKYNPFIMTSNT